MNSKKKKVRLTERHAKWQLLTMEQLGASINWILTLGIAVLGFDINYLVQYGSRMRHFWEFAFSMLLMLLSIAFGLYVTFNRLVDYRMTAKLLKRRVNGESQATIKNCKEELRILGERTWNIFAGQIALFSVGFVFLIAFFVSAYVFGSCNIK